MIALGACKGFQILAVNKKTGKARAVGSASPQELADMLVKEKTPTDHMVEQEERQASNVVVL